MFGGPLFSLAQLAGLPFVGPHFSSLGDERIPCPVLFSGSGGVFLVIEKRCGSSSRKRGFVQPAGDARKKTKNLSYYCILYACQLITMLYTIYCG
jgi:hypothetical protein